jgi:predicted acyl esterase
LDVSSSNFPHFDVNPNTGEPLQQHRRMMADNTVYHDATQTSFVELPIIPGARKEEALTGFLLFLDLTR